MAMTHVRVLALDFGDKRIGVAASDPLGITAQPVTTITRRSFADDVAEIRALIADKEAGIVLVGLPRNMDDSLGPKAQEVMAWVEKLRPLLGVPIEMEDERLTTVEAQERLKLAGVPAKRWKERVDAIAAQVLLEGWLEARRRTRRD
ncbi:MAG: Holliday junction resolvase RuvX [Planctomycetes bacterium]|nr:Holliday junction resolvase RuvX [Planctomycetota bacterium]